MLSQVLAVHAHPVGGPAGEVDPPVRNLAGGQIAPVEFRLLGAGAGLRGR